MKNFFYILSVLLASQVCNAQFAPQVGLAGSTAINKDSSIIVEWATNCIVNRGWLNMADTTLGKTTTGDSAKVIGIADADVVSLGDGGEAIIYFANPITNGNGFDFAVFENGFRNPVDSNEAYLELATVEVSNDGITYYNFAAQCNNDTTVQIAGVGQYMDARNLNNLAGKYITYYGTPFDLDELSMQFGLNVNDIHYIKIKDVVGTLDKAFCARDSYNNIINDPYPTAFPTGGFDLDAVAVINHKFPTEILNIFIENEIVFYPNPATEFIHFQNISKISNYKIVSVEGQILKRDSISEKINISDLKCGLYIIETESKEGIKSVYRIIKL